MSRPVDELGLGRALGDRVLPFLVGSMAFLAALAAAGAVGARSLAAYWAGGAEAALTVQIPRPDERADADGPSGVQSRMQRGLALLRADPAVESAEPLDADALRALLRPWFAGQDAPRILTLPGVIAVRLAPQADGAGLAAGLQAAVPETEVDRHEPWMRRLSVLAVSLQACAWLALAIVALVAVLVITVATRAGLATRREAIRIVHGLGATDGYIAARFAGRATLLAGRGALFGAAAAVPVLLLLAALAAPFASRDEPAGRLAGLALLIAEPLAAVRSMPSDLWIALAALPPAASAIGFLAAHGTVRRWLRRLP